MPPIWLTPNFAVILPNVPAYCPLRDNRPRHADVAPCITCDTQCQCSTTLICIVIRACTPAAHHGATKQFPSQTLWLPATRPSQTATASASAAWEHGPPPTQLCAERALKGLPQVCSRRLSSSWQVTTCLEGGGGAHGLWVWVAAAAAAAR